MNLALTVLPAVLLLYFVWRSQRQRVFLLGLPFLMDMYYSIFFERLKPFWVPVQLREPATYMMLWLVVTWVVYFDLVLPRRRRKVRTRRLFGPRLSAPEEIVLAGFAAYMIFKVGTTALHYMDLGSAISEAKVPLYVVAGYLLLRGIFCHAGRKETADFLAAVVVVNTIAAALYVLHQGLHIYIYAGAVEYQSIVVNGQVLTRSFYFMPQLLPLAIAFCAAKRTLNLFWIGVLLVTLAAVWVSYTRALVVVALVEISVVLAVRLLRQRDAWPAVKRVLQVIVVMAVFVGAAVALLPTQSAYLFSRLAETQAHGSTLQDTDLQVRVGWWRITNEWIGDDHRLLGMGFPSAAQDGRIDQLNGMAADTVWVPTLWNLGLIGVLGLACLFLAFGWRAFKLSLVGEETDVFLANILLGVVVGVFLQGFVEWTIFDPWHTPTALWFFALIAAIACRERVAVGQTATESGDQPTARDSLVHGSAAS